MSTSPGPAPTALTSIYSRKLSGPKHPADPVPVERNTRAGFTEVGSISVVVVRGKVLFSDSSSACRFLILIPCRLLPLLHEIVITVEHLHTLLLLRREYTDCLTAVGRRL